MSGVVCAAAAAVVAATSSYEQRVDAVDHHSAINPWTSGLHARLYVATRSQWHSSRTQRKRSMPNELLLFWLSRAIGAGLFGGSTELQVVIVAAPCRPKAKVTREHFSAGPNWQQPAEERTNYTRDTY